MISMFRMYTPYPSFLEGCQRTVRIGYQLRSSTIEPGCFLCAAELFEVSSSSMPFISNSAESTSTSNHSESNVTPTMRTQSAFTTTPSQPYTTNPADADVDSAPSHLPPPPPHRAASWAADGPSGMAGMTPAARLRAEAERPLPPPSRPSVSGSSGDSTPSSATTTPHIGSNSNITPSTSRPELTSDQGSDPTPVKVPDLEPKADGSFRPGIQRTAGERSSGSSGDGDPATAKPSSKRPKQESARHSDESQRTTQSTGLMAQRNLFGSLHVPAVRVIAPEGDLGLWFLFTVSMRPCVHGWMAERTGPVCSPRRNVSGISESFTHPIAPGGSKKLLCCPNNLRGKALMASR